MKIALGLSTGLIKNSDKSCDSQIHKKIQRYNLCTFRFIPSLYMFRSITLTIIRQRQIQLQKENSTKEAQIIPTHYVLKYQFWGGTNFFHPTTCFKSNFPFVLAFFPLHDVGQNDWAKHGARWKKSECTECCALCGFDCWLLCTMGWCRPKTVTSIFIARPDVGLIVIKFCIGGHCTNLLKVTYVFPSACDVVLAPNMLDRFFFLNSVWESQYSAIIKSPKSSSWKP